MELQHFSHKHPLILSEEKNDDGEDIVCNGCWQKISHFAYSCKHCKFFLHKLCAELPAEMKTPLHPEHPLTLLPQAPYGSYFICDVCDEDSYGFSYHCSPCTFDVDMRCATRVESFEHISHEHPLSPLLKAVLFLCDACGTEHKGLSYQCNTCNFWVHEDCASLPTTIKRDSHNHPLTLTGWNKYKNGKCGICGEELNKHCWIYHCEGCRYALHLNCSVETRERKSTIDVKDLDEANTIRLPVPEGSVNLIAQFAEQISLVNKKREVELDHFSHDHPLTLFNAHINGNVCTGSELSLLNEQKKNDKICVACVGPISAPFYHCGECSNFFLHKWCAELPNELQHPCHEHALQQCCTIALFSCQGCNNFSNGFSFRCEMCDDYCLDVNCATLPSSIVHEVHDHPLLLRDNCHKVGCAACADMPYMFSYGCGTCNFNLHYKCALLPRHIMHRYDEHPFILTYAPPPIKEDGSEEEYYCEFCEKEIDTSKWFYHCVDCDQSACAKCFCIEKELFPRFNFFGSTYNFNRHPHPLHVVQPTIDECPLCDCCHKRIDYNIALRCAKCDIMLDPYCAQFGLSDGIASSCSRKYSSDLLR